VSQVHRFASNDTTPQFDMQTIREACWKEVALQIRYTDKQGLQTERAVFPLSIVYVQGMLVLLAWCCLREDFRMFRIERLLAAEATSTSFRPRRVALLRTYLNQLKDYA
jgi:predicted DNA-binding transcriptional regulator YafY